MTNHKKPTDVQQKDESIHSHIPSNTQPPPATTTDIKSRVGVALEHFVPEVRNTMPPPKQNSDDQNE